MSLLRMLIIRLQIQQLRQTPSVHAKCRLKLRAATAKTIACAPIKRLSIPPAAFCHVPPQKERSHERRSGCAARNRTGEYAMFSSGRPKPLLKPEFTLRHSAAISTFMAQACTNCNAVLQCAKWNLDCHVMATAPISHRCFSLWPCSGRRQPPGRPPRFAAQ